MSHFYLAPTIINLFVLLQFGDRYFELHQYFNFIINLSIIMIDSDIKFVHCSLFAIAFINLTQYKYNIIDKRYVRIIKMYCSSKTQSYEREYLHLNQLDQHPTLNQGMYATNFALSKALQNISQLQQNLQFMLQLNNELTNENDKLKANSERVSQYVKNQQQAQQKAIKQLQKQHEQVIQLLETTKITLLDTENELIQTKQQVQRCNRIIYEQKKAYQQLQQQYMNKQYSYVEDTYSLNVSKADLHYVAELERENNDLQIQLKKQSVQMQKQQTKMNKALQENVEFKKWIASVLGLQKVVEGTEKILLQQIRKRMLP